MKKLLLSLLMVVGVVTVVSASTQAVFSDKEVIAGNTFAAAQLDLQLGEPSSLPFVLEDVKPGDSGEIKITLTNVGSIDGKLSIVWKSTVDKENNTLEPETEAYPRVGGGSTTPDSDAFPNGELDQFLQFAPYVDVDNNGQFDNSDYQLTKKWEPKVYPGHDSRRLYWEPYFSNHSGVSGLYLRTLVNNQITLAAGNTVTVVIPWKFPVDTPDANYHPNIAMTDSMGFDLEFTLTQNTPSGE